MSKVNVDDIEVNDLVEMTYNHSGKKALGVVSDILGETIFAYWSDDKRQIEDSTYLLSITGHWKVINFDELPESPYTEEETKMDELKVYTGKKTIELLLEGKTLKWAGDQYRLEGKQLKEKNGANEWARSYRSLDHFMNNKFTEVETPQVGDWVRIELPDTTIVGCITEVDNLVARIDDRLVSLKHYWEILSPEQVSEYKREQAFVKVGRKPNEFRSGDIVYVGATGETAIIISKQNEEDALLHVFNQTGKGYTAKPHQLTPISFVEQQVDLS